MNRLITIALTLTLAPAAFAQSKPDPARLKADAAQLDQLEKASMADPDALGDELWRASKRVADQRGPAIIHALMERSRKWQGEEMLIFVPLVALLPRGEALKLLKEYAHSKHESERTYAREFQTELKAEDVQEAVRKYSKVK